MNPSVAVADINAHLQHSFRHLISNGIRKSALDDFESFVTAPGTLSRPSLIIRCRINNHDPEVRVVVNKDISRWRLSTCFEPFLQRVLPRIHGQSEFFVLVSDKLYVADEAQTECLDFFKNVPFLRCDYADIDLLSMLCIVIPVYFLQD